MEIKNEKDVSYQVMPNTANNSTVPQPSNSGSGFSNSKLLYGAIAAVVLLILAFGVYYFVGIKKDPDSTVSYSTASKQLLQKYFGQELCTDKALCGDESDSDNDGLTTKQELDRTAEQITNPTKADTDDDGLADGDEINIYKTDPTNMYTDSREIAKTNNFTDSVEIKNNYNPLTPGRKYEESSISEIKNAISQFKLHVPTTVTLNLTSDGSPAQVISLSDKQPQTHPLAIQNNQFPSLTIKAGDSVTWTNQDNAKHEIASDPHPTHTALPGFQSQVLASGESFSFTFTKAGNWGYHDHLNPATKATITVK